MPFTVYTTRDFAASVKRNTEATQKNTALLEATNNPVIGGGFNNGWISTNNAPVMGQYLTGPYSNPGSLYAVGVNLAMQAITGKSGLSVPIRKLENGYSTDVFMQKFKDYKEATLITPLSTGIQDALLQDPEVKGVLVPGFHALEKDAGTSKTVVKIFDYVQAVDQIWSDLGLDNTTNFIVLNVRYGNFPIAYGLALDEYFKTYASSFRRYYNGVLQQTIPTTGNGPKVQSHDLDITQGMPEAEVQNAINVFKNLPNLVIFTHLWGNNEAVYDTLLANGFTNNVYMGWWGFPWKIKPTYAGMNYLTPIDITGSALHDSLALYDTLNNGEISKLDHPIVLIGMLVALVNFSIISSSGPIISQTSVTSAATTGKIDDLILSLLSTNEGQFFSNPMTAGYNLSRIFLRTL